MNFQMFKLVLEKVEEPVIKLTTSAGSWKKQENSRKTPISALLTMPKPLTVDHKKLWTILKEMATWPASWETYMQVRKQQSELGHGTTDWFQIGKGICQGCILSPCLFNFYAEYIMRNAGLEETQAEIKIAGRNINHLRYADDTTLMADMQMTPPLWQKMKKN